MISALARIYAATVPGGSRFLELAESSAVAAAKLERMARGEPEPSAPRHAINEHRRLIDLARSCPHRGIPSQDCSACATCSAGKATHSDGLVNLSECLRCVSESKSTGA